MKIGIIGAGRIGNALGEAWNRENHDIMYGVREPDRYDGELKVSTVDSAAAHGDVVVFAIPGSAMSETINNLTLDGKAVIDCTNGGPAPADIASTIPDAAVYKAFNTLGFENFREPQFGDEHADLLYIGPDSHREVIEQLIHDVGLNPVHIGDLDEIGTLDAATRFWFALSKRFGRHTAYKVLLDS